MLAISSARAGGMYAATAPTRVTYAIMTRYSVPNVFSTVLYAIMSRASRVARRVSIVPLLGYVLNASGRESVAVNAAMTATVSHQSSTRRKNTSSV